MTKKKKSRANDGPEDCLQMTATSARANQSAGTPGSSPTGRVGNSPSNAETAPLANGQSPFGKTRSETVCNSLHLDGDAAGNRMAWVAASVKVKAAPSWWWPVSACAAVW